MIVGMKRISSHGMRWDKKGRCYEQNNDEPAHRRPDMDFGTPNCEVLFPAWMQDAAMAATKKRRKKKR